MRLRVQVMGGELAPVLLIVGLLCFCAPALAAGTRGSMAVAQPASAADTEQLASASEARLVDANAGEDDEFIASDEFKSLAPGEQKVIIVDPTKAGSRAASVLEKLGEQETKQHVRLVEKTLPDGRKVTYEILDELIEEDEEGDEEAEAAVGLEDETEAGAGEPPQATTAPEPHRAVVGARERADVKPDGEEKSRRSREGAENKDKERQTKKRKRAKGERRENKAGQPGPASDQDSRRGDADEGTSGEKETGRPTTVSNNAVASVQLPAQASAAPAAATAVSESGRADATRASTTPKPKQQREEPKVAEDEANKPAEVAEASEGPAERERPTKVKESGKQRDASGGVSDASTVAPPTSRRGKKRRRDDQGEDVASPDNELVAPKTTSTEAPRADDRADERGDQHPVVQEPDHHDEPKKSGDVSIKGVGNRKRKLVDKLEKNILKERPDKLVVEDSGNETEEVIKERKLNEVPAPDAPESPGSSVKGGDLDENPKAKSAGSSDQLDKPDDEDDGVEEEKSPSEENSVRPSERKAPPEDHNDDSGHEDGGSDDSATVPKKRSKGQSEKQARKRDGDDDAEHGGDETVAPPNKKKKKGKGKKGGSKGVRGSSKNKSKSEPAKATADDEGDDDEEADEAAQEQQQLAASHERVQQPGHAAQLQQQVPPAAGTASTVHTHQPAHAGTTTVLQPGHAATHNVEAADSSGELKLVQPHGSQTKTVQPASQQTVIEQQQQQQTVVDPGQHETVVIEEKTTVHNDDQDGDDGDDYDEEEWIEIEEGGGRRGRRRGRRGRGRRRRGWGRGRRG